MIVMMLEEEKGNEIAQKKNTFRHLEKLLAKHKVDNGLKVQIMKEIERIVDEVKSEAKNVSANSTK